MKKIVTTIILLSGVLMLFAQTPVDRVFDKYAGKDGYTTVYISSYMFNLMSNIETNDPDYEEFKKASEGIESIRILAQEGSSGPGFARELLDILPRSEYQELMVVKEENEEVLFLAREEQGKISEFLLIVDSGGEDALIVITGDIDLESISSLANSMDMPAMQNLEELEEDQ